MENKNSLGASEFAATLNGDDPHAILLALKQFTKIVQKERRLALSEEVDEGESDSSDEESSDEEEVEQPPAKKLKKDEQWKEDSASYHVPFVGTSVAKGEVAEVIRGQWPTGLLRAYLIKSPLAIELTSDDLSAPEGQIHKSLLRKKQMKTSRSIQKAYLRALAELVTAVIPIDKLKEDRSIDEDITMVEDCSSAHDKFFPVLLKKRLTGIFQLLNEETGRGRGKTRVLGGCGNLVAPALKLLQNIASISVTNARLVARHLDETLIDGVLRCLLRPLPPRKESTANSDDVKVRSKDARVEAINLATTLIKTRDSAVNTYICTMGSRERKVKPGILYTAFREGLLSKQQGSTMAESDDNYMEAVADMIHSFRSLILNHSRSINRKLLFDLLARDPLLNMCQLLSYAPPMTNDNTFVDVLNEKDSYSELESLPKAAVEARRLLLPVLSDSSRSPFLASTEQQLVRTLIQLLHVPNGGIQMHHFLIDCTIKTPALFPSFFRMLRFPDPKKTFDFIASLHFVTSLIRRGPSAVACLSTTTDSTGNMDDILVTLFPIQFKRQALARALQSDNSLVVLECLKLIKAVVDRFDLLRAEGSKQMQWSDDYINRLSAALIQWLPDMQVMLKVRAQFDAFSQSKECALINDCLHRILERFAVVLPSLVREVKFDWMKLIPNKTNRFFQALPLVQRSVLRTLKLIIGVCDSPSHSLLHSCKTILEIMLTTRSKVVHDECRQIALELLMPIMQSRWTDIGYAASIKYECKCWIDGLTSDSLSSFCKLVQNVSEDALQTIASIGQTWTVCRNLGPIEFSLFLVASWTATETSPALSLLTAQVSMKAILFHRSPLVLATFIQLFSDNNKTASILRTPLTTYLVEYSKALCQFDQDAESARIKLLGKILESLLSTGDRFAVSFRWLNGDSSTETSHLLHGLQSNQTFENVVSFTRFLIHFHIISNGSGVVAKRCRKLLCQIVPNLLLQQCSAEEKNRILEDIHLCRGHDEIFVLLITSCPFASDLGFTHSRIRELSSSVASTTKGIPKKERRMRLLEFPILGDTIPMNNIAKAQLILMENLESSSEGSLVMPIDFIRGFIENTSSRIETDAEYELDVVRSLFTTWWALSNPDTRRSSLEDIRSHLSLVLTTILKKDDTQSAMVVTLMKGKTEVDLIRRCLKSLSERRLIQHESPCKEVQFLGSALNSDLVRLAPRFLDEFNRMDVLVKNSWQNGQLDYLLLLILQQSSTLFLEADCVQALSHNVFSRTQLSLSTVIAGDRDLVDAKSVLDLSQALLKLTTIADEVDVSVDLFEKVSATLKMGELRQNPAAKSLCQLAMLLVQRFNSDSQKPGATKMSRQYLASTMFLRCIEWLPYTYKIQEAASDERVDTHAVLTCLMTLCDIQDFDLNVLRSTNPMLIQKVFRSCLKYGIGLSEQNPVISSMSLKLVRELATRLSDPRSAIGPLKEHLLVIPLADIFNMMTSHSKFTALLSGSTKELDCVKLELVRLMVCCVARSSGGIVMGDDVWTALFGAFNAGLGELDTAIRKLFYACCDLLSGSETAHIPFLDEFRWKGFSESGPQGGSRWDCFVNALDPNRIRSTISHFPMYDTVEVDLGTGEEKDEMSDDEEAGSEQNSEDEDSPEDDDASTDADSVDTRIQGPNGLSPGVEWDPHGQDLRYSPAFLLPFILGALESTLPENKTKVVGPEATPSLQGGTDRFTEQKRYELLVLMAQKICDRGALSLCLASLSSKCEKVRYYALSILSVLLTACDSTEARDLSSWHCRPQLAMLLNSIQRAFVIKKVSNNSSRSRLQIPVLSPLISTFLARASLSIVKPDDALFVPMNRYFLKNERDHGAFPDMNRLPGFISLFCSASDDPSQSRKERMWALQLLRDGFLDSSCYRLVAACHAPELILTAFENLRLSQVSDEMKDAEYTLMLNVLAKLLDFGSNRVTSHLVSRLGLLSWMRSWCTSWPLSESFPRIKSRVAFCELVNCSVKQASRDRRLRTDSFVHEVCGLVQPVIVFGAKSNNSDEGSPLLIRTICEALDSLSMVVLQMKEDNTYFDVQPLGISLERTIKFLNLIDAPLRKKAAIAVSSLPICFDNSNVEEAIDLSSILLGCCLRSQSENSADQLSLIIERVMLIASHFGGALAPSSQPLKMLLAIRSSFVSSEQQHNVYNQCLKVLASNETAVGTEFIVARELLK